MGGSCSRFACYDPPFVKVCYSNKKVRIGKKRFKSFRTMDDLIRYLEILPPGQSYKLKSAAYGELAPWDDIRIFRELTVSTVEKKELRFITLFCTPLYGSF